MCVAAKNREKIH